MNVKKGIAVNIFWILLGTVLIIVSEIGKVDGIYSGMGGGFIGVGIYQLFRTLRYSKNEEYREKIDVEISDERNHYIRLKAWSVTSYISVVILALITITCMILAQEFYMKIAAFAECFLLVVYYISYMVLKNRY